MSSLSQAEVASRRKRWFPITAILLGLVAGTLISAGLLQLRAYLFPSTQWIYLQEPGHEKSGHRYIYDETLGWKNIPNWKGTTFGRPLSINSRGLRDREYPYRKPPGATRILVLGDSYTWGYGVSNDEIYTEVIEDELFKGAKCEVLNTGVSGWGTDQQYLFLRDEGFRYEPDIVIVSFFFGNDFREISSSQQYHFDKPVFMNRSLKLANVPVPKPKKNGVNRVYRSQVRAEELALVIFSRMASDCRAHDCQLVVFKFGTYVDPPTTRDFNTSMPQQQRQNIIEMAQASEVFQVLMGDIPNLKYFDMDQAFEARGLTFEQLGVTKERDMHWNAFGHREVAQALSAFLSKEGCIDFYTPNQATP